MNYLVFTVLMALFVSMALAMQEDRTPRRRLQAAARAFLWCAVATVGGGWLMHLIHG